MTKAGRMHVLFGWMFWDISFVYLAVCNRGIISFFVPLPGTACQNEYSNYVEACFSDMKCLCKCAVPLILRHIN